MTVIHAGQALLPSGWQDAVRVGIGGDGRIALVTQGAAQPGDERCAVLLPAMGNLHSHAFQRAMAGRAERRGPGDDNFWSWREAMYRFGLTMGPEDVQATATLLYMEMLEAGFCRVGEFHYLHHDPEGQPYADPAEMAGRIAAAAEETGIGLTLLPVFYAHATFGGAPPAAGQRRFINGLDGFARLLERSASLIAPLPEARLGVAPHSLRAVTPEELAAVTAMTRGPVHIHAAEQVREVKDCLAWSGQRPVEWLLRHASVDARWCLIHATHMTETETVELAARGAVAGLCPVTEANLGDGTFNGAVFHARRGLFGVGSDSNVLIGLADELRQYEYAQRLHARARNVIADPGESVGRVLYDTALAGAARALDTEAGIAAGKPADLLALDIAEGADLRGDDLLDAFVFTRSVRVDRVWSGGRKQVEGGHHRMRGRISARFRASMTALAGS